MQGKACTGNYHEKTAREYTDLGLLTSDQDITTDVQFIFQLLKKG